MSSANCQLSAAGLLARLLHTVSMHMPVCAYQPANYMDMKLMQILLMKQIKAAACQGSEQGSLNTDQGRQANKGYIIYKHCHRVM